MAEFITVLSQDELQPGDRIVLEVKEHYVAVFRVGDQYYAIEDLCTHDEGPLAEGELHGTEIECPRHGARFDLKTGAALSLPAVTPVPWYPVRLKDGEVQIEI